MSWKEKQTKKQKQTPSQPPRCYASSQLSGTQHGPKKPEELKEAWQCVGSCPHLWIRGPKREEARRQQGAASWPSHHSRNRARARRQAVPSPMRRGPRSQPRLLSRGASCSFPRNRRKPLKRRKTTEPDRHFGATPWRTAPNPCGGGGRAVGEEWGTGGGRGEGAEPLRQDAGAR